MFSAPAVRAFDANPSVVLPATGTVEVLFAPWQDIETRIVGIIGGARRELYVQAFLFTSKPIGKALIEAQKRGVSVEVLADLDMNGKGDRTQIPQLVAAGVAVALETRYSSAHNKVILTDPSEPDGVLITGSYNFTFSARMKNAENILVMRGNRALAQTYLDNWRRHKRDAIAWEDRGAVSEKQIEPWKKRHAND